MWAPHADRFVHTAPTPCSHILNLNQVFEITGIEDKKHLTKYHIITFSCQGVLLLGWISFVLSVSGHGEVTDKLWSFFGYGGLIVGWALQVSAPPNRVSVSPRRRPF